MSGGWKASHKREEGAEAWPFSERLGIAQGSTNRSRRKLLQSVTKLSETEVNVTPEAKHANPGSKMAKWCLLYQTPYRSSVIDRRVSKGSQLPKGTRRNA